MCLKLAKYLIYHHVWWFIQMHARAHGHILGDGVPGGRGAGQLRLRWTFLWTDPTTPPRIPSPSSRARIFYRSYIYAAHALHRNLPFHQRL